MSNKTDAELIRVHLKNMQNAVDFYSEQIEHLLQRMEARGNAY